jgi:DNA-directed RNA polymerase subunit RPC12/RpoP
MSVRCLCWNCGREITVDEEIVEVNEELWCEECAAPAIGKPDNDYDEKSL